MRLLRFVIFAGLLSACDADARGVQKYSLSIPADWRPWSGAVDPLVPGEVLEAHELSVPSGAASLIVFRSLHRPATTAAQLLIETRHLLLNLPSLEIQAERLIEVKGQNQKHRALVIEVTASGTGKTLSPTGTGKPVHPSGEPQIATRRIWVRVPLGPGGGTLEVFFHCPQEEHSNLTAVWTAILDSLLLLGE